MAKKDEVNDVFKPVDVRAQTEGEIRKRLRSQGKLPKDVKKEDNGVHNVTDEEALVRIAERNERKEIESKKENKLVRPLTDKDVALRLAASKKREEAKEGAEETGKFLTEEDIKNRNKPDPDPKPDPDEDKDKDKDKDEPVEIYAKDTVTFKDDDGNTITGKVKRVKANGEAIVEDDDAEYTLSCDLLTKVDKEEK